jgi:hypothetical protein
MLSGRSLRNIALRRMLLSSGTRAVISAKRAAG